MKDRHTPNTPKRIRVGHGKGAAIVLQFVVLFVFWLILSGRYELKYIIIGAFAAGVVTSLTNDLLYAPAARGSKGENGPLFALKCSWRLLMYLPWFVLAIMKANIQVASLVLNPRLPINPALLRFKTQMRREVSLVTLANSITLTPGTITVNLEQNTFLVHAIVPEAAGDLQTGLMQNKVGHIFGESKGPPPKILWARFLEELD